ncbi:36089_t:CDS:1, partial [Racocetra persica]
PTIFTCIRCKGYWPFTVTAIGQLSPWSFKMFNDGMAAMLKAREEDNEKNRNYVYAYVGATFSCLLGAAGWIGLTALCFSLLHTSYAVSKWIWAVYSIPIFFIVLALLCRVCGGSGSTTFIFVIFAYFGATTHILGSHIILSNISGNWSGFPTEKVALVSSLIFFLGKRLLYVNC